MARTYHTGGVSRVNGKRGVDVQKELPIRKHPRLKGYAYSKNGAYFITICVKDKHNLLGTVVGRDVFIAPTVKLSEYGNVVDKHINKINSLGKGAVVDKYVIMPNHVHMLIMIENEIIGCISGAMKTSRPTTIPNLLRSFKTMVSKEIGVSLWQTSYHDHIIRDETDYLRIWQYIDENPMKWTEDKYYSGKG